VWLAGRAPGKRRLPWLVLAALACALASFALDLHGWRGGLDPTASAWAAAVAALASYQGLHIVLLAVLGALPGAARLARPPGPAQPRHARQHRPGLALHDAAGHRGGGVVRLLPLLME
jgi:cytochrome c oxidase subunit I+III